MPLLQLRQAQWRSVFRFGALVALLLAFGLGWALFNDRGNRIAFAQRQSLTAVSGVERLLRLEFHNLERSMLGIARDAQAVAPAPLASDLRSVLDRHAELDSLVVLDLQGNPLTPGRGDPRIARWTLPQARGEGHALYVGPLERTAAGAWVLRLALRMDPDRWLLARLRTDGLQELVSSVDLGRDGVLSVLRPDGTLIARSSGPAMIGNRLTPALRWDAPAPRRAVALGAMRSRVDGHRRISAASMLGDYPLLVFAGFDERETLRPWWTFLATASLLFVAYCLSLAYLLRKLRGAERRQAQLLSKLRSGDEDLRRAHQAGGVGTWWIGQDGDCLHLSPQTVEMFALARPELPAADFIARVHPDDRLMLRRTLAKAWNDAQGFDVTCRLQLPGQGERWIALRGAMMDAGERRVTGTVVDVSERVEIQTLALDAQRQFRLIFEINPLPCWLFDLDTLRFLEVNPAAIRQYGYSREEFLAMRVTDLHPPGQAEPGMRRMREPDTGGRGNRLTVVHRHKDGSLIDVRVHTTTLEIAGLQAQLVLAENVSEYVAYQRELAHRASHDAATGLLNVRTLAEQLRDAGMPRYTIAHVQLRGLQLIGDTLGRRVGEDVLHSLCGRLQALADKHGWLAFQPSEDFVLAIGEEHDPPAVIDALVAMLSEPVRGRDSLHPLDVRIGVAGFPGDGARADEVIAQAAQAAHAAREAGVTVMPFDKAIAARLSERLHLAGRLHEAIDRGEFALHYQPIIDARRGVPVALEALVRWLSPERGLVPPDEFIRLCEDTGLILPLGRWAIRQGAHDQRRLADAGWAGLPVAINVSALQLLNTDVAGDVAAACREFGLGHGALHVELTETSLVHDPGQVLQTMQRLHAQGVCVSLDDFGTGFSSMSYLRQMPLDSLKIDRSFVADVDRDPRSAAICRTLIALGHDLDLKIIAEGVERPGQQAWLASNGCDQLQGYLLGRPLPLEALIAQLRGDSGRPPPGNVPGFPLSRE